MVMAHWTAFKPSEWMRPGGGWELMWIEVSSSDKKGKLSQG